MAIFGLCKTTITCSKVSCFLQKLDPATDKSTHTEMFRTLLSSLGLKWHNSADEMCLVEGSWEAMVKSNALFTAIQKASCHPQIYDDMALLYEWSTSCSGVVHPVSTTSNSSKVPLSGATRVKNLNDASNKSPESGVDADYICPSLNLENHNRVNTDSKKDVEEVCGRN